MIGSISALTTPQHLQISVKVTFPQSLLELDKRIKQKLPGTMRRIALEGKSFWKSEAGRKLKSSRRAYQDAIDMKVNQLDIELTLTGFLAYSVDQGNKAYDMKPGLLKNALPWPPKRLKIPRDKASELTGRTGISRYKVIPLNPNHYVNMQKPRVFRMVTDKSSGWKHKGWQTPTKISDSVVEELDKNIIPRHIETLLNELDK